MTVAKGKITGSLAYVDDYTGFSGDAELQKGHFLALHWSNPAEGVTSLKAGIVPSSIGADPVECISDTDRNGVFRVTDPSTQRIVLIQEDNAGHKNIQSFKLNNLVLEEAPSEDLGA